MRLAKAVGYVNAGTCEFLLGPDGGFYFLEVNARLQVEHPVTELRTGLDLVREQLRVAAGLPLSVTQDQVDFRGHAIEARISAEDPYNRFLPASGVVAALRNPEGPGVRNDSGLYDGMEVPLYYDPLLAKLICYGEDREQAIARLRRAVDEYVISGVRTTLPFVTWLLRHPRFVAGDFSTDFIAQEWNPLTTSAAGETGLAPTAAHGEENGREAGALNSQVVAALGSALAAEDEATSLATRSRSQNGARWRRLALEDGWAARGAARRLTGRRCARWRMCPMARRKMADASSLAAVVSRS